VRASTAALPLPALRLRSPAPLPRSRRPLGPRRPAPRRLPALTARCRHRRFLSRNPFSPPLGESLGPAATRVSHSAVLAGVLQEHPRPRADVGYRTRCKLSSTLGERQRKPVRRHREGFSLDRPAVCGNSLLTL